VKVLILDDSMLKMMFVNHPDALDKLKSFASSLTTKGKSLTNLAKKEEPKPSSQSSGKPKKR